MKKILIAALASAALVACGGGGGGDDDPAPSADGFWNGDDFGMLITPNGELWVIDASGTEIVLIQGTVTTSGNSFSATGRAYIADQSAPGTASGTFTPRATISGTAAIQGFAPSPFTATYSTFYDSAPSPAALAGNWTPTDGGALTFDANGNFTALNNGCSMTGTATPDTSGKNFYRLAVNFGPAPCAFPGLSASGVLVANGTFLTAAVVKDGLGGTLLATKN